jgi:beta-glucosidase
VWDILTGGVNPSGKLAETFPVKLEDNPAELNFPGEGDAVEYREGLFVGYRYYDRKKMEVRFPFGYGLSYTQFSYEGIRVSAPSIRDTETLSVTVSVRNTGKLRGKEIVQLYVEAPRTGIIRPDRELKGFEKIDLEPGQSGTVQFTLDKRSFAYWEADGQYWRVPGGIYTIAVGPHSRSLPLKAVVTLKSMDTRKIPYTINTILGEALQHPLCRELIFPALEAIQQKAAGDDQDLRKAGITLEVMRKLIENVPLRGLISASGGALTEEKLTELLAAMNREA